MFVVVVGWLVGWLVGCCLLLCFVYSLLLLHFCLGGGRSGGGGGGGCKVFATAFFGDKNLYILMSSLVCCVFRYDYIVWLVTRLVVGN